MGSVNDIDLSQLYDATKSLVEGASTVPGYKADGWSVRIFTESGFLDPDKPIHPCIRGARGHVHHLS